MGDEAAKSPTNPLLSPHPCSVGAASILVPGRLGMGASRPEQPPFGDTACWQGQSPVTAE